MVTLFYIKKDRDDGISGTRFDRPGFMAMMDEVNKGNVGTICIKDMSRMGRDYLKVGQIMEMLRKASIVSTMHALNPL